MRFVSGTTAIVALGSTLLRSVETQVTTSCNPLKGACPNNPGLAKSYYSIDFTSMSTLPSEWVVADSEKVTLGKSGAEFTFRNRYDAPTMSTDFAFFFGRVEYLVKAAAGTGIISSMVLLSDDLDEIDWEFRGGITDSVQTNYFGKGYTGTYNRSSTPSVTSPQTSFHTYAVDWSPTALVWSIDGKVVRTLNAADADGNGSQYPQTPMKVSLSLWDGGDPAKDPATIDWAGGETDLNSGDAYTMYVSKVSIWNSYPAQQYKYTDKSGSFRSIQRLNQTMAEPAMQPNKTQTLSLAPLSTMYSNHSKAAYSNHSSSCDTDKKHNATYYPNVTFAATPETTSSSSVKEAASSTSITMAPYSTSCITTVITSNGVVTTSILSVPMSAAASSPATSIATSNNPVSTGSTPVPAAAASNQPVTSLATTNNPVTTDSPVAAAATSSPSTSPCTTCKTVLLTSNSVISTSTLTIPISTAISQPAATSNPTSTTCITTLVTTNGVVSVETLTLTPSTFAPAAPSPVTPSSSAAAVSNPPSPFMAASSFPSTPANSSISITPLPASAAASSAPTTLSYSTTTNTITSTNTYTWTAPYPYANGTSSIWGTTGGTGTAAASATGSAYYPAQSAPISYSNDGMRWRGGVWGVVVAGAVVFWFF